MIALPKKVLLILSALAAALLTVFLIIFSFRSPSKQFVKLPDGFIVNVTEPYAQGASRVKVQAVTDHIIHVTAGLSDSLANAASLMVIDQPRNPAWELVEEGGNLVLQTAALRAVVSQTTGDVTFTDRSGNTILKEVPNAGKSITPVNAGDESYQQICQTFEASAGEAFYGLCQHQNGHFNYRGEQVLLLQQNSTVAVPFVVSTKNYGLLWDNYSITRFGDCRLYEQISSLNLSGADGQAGGLTATYTSRKHPGQVRVERKEAEIDYEFIPLLKKLPSGYDLNDGLVTWEGTIASPVGGDHKFLLTSGGYVKLWVDGKLLADKWRQCWNPATYTLTVRLEKDKKYPLKLEWIPDGGESYISLKYLPPVPEKKRNTFSFSSEAADHIDYYFVYGNNLDEVIAGYRHLTGRAPIMPRWAMGFWQSRERYKSQEELLSVASEFRRRKIPIDNIVQDWFYWKEDQWGSHDFDPARFPDPDQMIEDLHEKYKLHFMISVWPKFYTGTKHYDLFNSKGWLYRQNVLNGQKDWVGPGYVSTFYDAYNPDARTLFWDLMRDKLYKKGVDAWWMDATEPDVLSNSSIADRKKLHGPTALGSATKYFNGYAIANAKGVYEGQRSTDPDKRVFILTRSAYGGMQRYAAATWSGDIGARWHDMKNQIAAGINFSLSGLPYWTMDIGGFAVEKRFEHATGKDLDEWRELMTRWYQFGAFCPIFRAHGQFPFREIFHVAPDHHAAYQSMLYYDQLRYRLMPYIYSLAGHTWHNNYTIMRALVMDFPEDTAVHNLGDQYLFGPSLLVNPVYEFGARYRNLYLPKTGWYDFYTGKYYSGGSHIAVPAPYERMPLFVKEGAIIPAGPALQYTDEKPADPITLFVYTGADGSFTLYEDECTNYNYEKGKFSNIPLRYIEDTKTLTIGKREGSFDGMLTQRTFRIVWIDKATPKPFDPDMAADEVVKYDGQELVIGRK